METPQLELNELWAWNPDLRRRSDVFKPVVYGSEDKIHCNSELIVNKNIMSKLIS